MGRITLSGVRKDFDGAAVIHGADLEIEDGSFVVFVGPSGCGKTTLLRLIAGLEDVSDGKILIDGKDVTHMSPASRGLSMVFQSYALYPHMTVRNNIAFGLKMSRVPKEEIAIRVAAAAETLNLTEHLDRRPAQLSGGQRQRVAIGRAIVREPNAFLFDEPLSNLDAALRTQMRLEVVRLQRNLRTTAIYVTHDQVEAMTMAQQIVVLRAGRIEQVGSPLELYERPANVFVASFIGSPCMNLLTGSIADRHGASTLGVRPEHIQVNHGVQASGSAKGWEGVVVQAEHLGSDTFVHVEAVGVGLVTARCSGGLRVMPGESVTLIPDAARLYRFDAQERAIPA